MFHGITTRNGDILQSGAITVISSYSTLKQSIDYVKLYIFHIGILDTNPKVLIIIIVHVPYSKSQVLHNYDN